MFLTFTGPQGQDIAIATHLVVAVADYFDNEGKPAGLAEIYVTDQKPILIRGSAMQIVHSIQRHVDSQAPF